MAVVVISYKIAKWALRVLLAYIALKVLVDIIWYI